VLKLKKIIPAPKGLITAVNYHSANEWLVGQSMV